MRPVRCITQLKISVNGEKAALAGYDFLTDKIVSMSVIYILIITDFSKLPGQ